MAFPTNTLSEQRVCFVCLIRPYIRMAIAFGSIGHSCSCPHVNKAAKIASFHRSYIAICTTVLIVTLNITIISYNIWYLIYRDTKGYGLATIIFKSSTCTMQILTVFARNSSIKEYTGLAAIIEHCEIYGIRRIFDKKDIKNFKLQTIFTHIALTFILILYIACNVIFITDIHFWEMFNIAFKTIDGAIAIIICIISAVHMNVYVQLMNACYTQIKKCLNERIENQNEPNITVVSKERMRTKPNRTGSKSGNIIKTYKVKSITKSSTLNRLLKLQNRTVFHGSVAPEKSTFNRSVDDQRRAKFKTILETTENIERKNLLWNKNRAYEKFKISTLTQLQKLQRMHLAIMINIEQFNDVLNPTSLVSFLTVCSVQIIGYYFMVRYWMNSEWPEGPVVILYIDVVFAFIFSVWILLICNSAYSPGNDILKFLENFPVNLLSVIEVSQIEALTDAVRIMKPTITVSGIFDFNLDVFSSITAVVVSYVLLAIQFQGAWQKE